MSRSLTFVLLLVVLFVCIGPLAAQEGPTSYVVISAQPAIARECPRPDCAIVDTLPHGTVFAAEGITTGGLVFGSSQWVQLDLNGQTVYIHGSRVDAIKTGAMAIGDEMKQPADADSSPVDTSHWVEFSGNGVRLEAPSTWMDIGALLKDDDYWSDYTKAYSAEAAQHDRNWMNGLYQSCLDGTNDLIVTDPYQFGLLITSHVPIDPSLSAIDLLMAASQELLAGSGAPFVSANLVDLPAGQGIHTSMTTDVVSADGHLIIIGDSLYSVILYVNPADAARYSGWAEAVAQSFRAEENDDWFNYYQL